MATIAEILKAQAIPRCWHCFSTLVKPVEVTRQKSGKPVEIMRCMNCGNQWQEDRSTIKGEE